jgi:glycosyltransferase involved in cell wall biosynthesis
MIVVYHGLLPFHSSRHLGLMEAYARRTRVVYVDPDPDPKCRRLVETHVRCNGSTEGAHEIVHLKMPHVLPGSGWRPVGSAQRWLAMRGVLRELERRYGEEIVLVSQHPRQLPTLRGLPAAIKVYEVRDDYAGFALDEATARRVRRAHMRMLRECDVVWAISGPLVDDIRPFKPDVVRTNVGVEFERFANASATDCPASLAAVPHPRIGLIGNLNDRIDWNVLVELCRLRPEWQIVLIGPVYHAKPDVRRQLERVAALPNAHVLGPVDRSQLPAAMAALDVGMIPYLTTRANTRINPLKLYQYLAAGIPVVATRLPSVADLADVVELFDGAAELATAVERALAARDDPARRAARRAKARASDWQAIADLQVDVLEASIARRRARS